MPVFFYSLPEGVRLIVPVLLAELLHCGCEWFIYRDPGLPQTNHDEWKRRAAHVMSTVRLPGRIAVCCVGVGFSLTVCLEGTRLFPHSVFLSAAKEQQGLLFLWVVGILGLTALCAVFNQDAFRNEHRLKSLVFLYSSDENAAGTQLTALDDADEAAHWIPRALSVSAGWVIVYLSLLFALVSPMTAA